MCGLLILPVPLVRDFHFESAMIAAVAGCFWAGISFSRTNYRTAAEKLVPIFRSVYLFAVPPFLFALSTGCLNLDGLGFWVLFPIPSIFFGAAIGLFFRRFVPRFSTFASILTLLWVSLGVLLVEFFNLPQVYFFNHVWGGWPGPIYDESVQVTGSLVVFRSMTLLWSLGLWSVSTWKLSRLSRILTLVCTAGLAFIYLNLTAFGIITPRDHLKKELSHHHHTEHFEFYADADHFSEEEIEYWALRHELHFQQIINVLDIEWPEGRKIESFLYANAWQKKELVGAKFTSYVPIWLEQDQLHIAKQQLDGVLKHEMVHVISKQFGNDLFNGTWSIGLIEGLAEGIAKDASRTSTLDQLMAANPPYPDAEQIRSALTFSGFYSGAGAISYTTTGSFVQFLLENYPVRQFKEAYASSDFVAAYEQPLDSLVEAWKRSLPEIQIDSLDRSVSERLFSQRSIFQKTCPHSLSPALELWDELQYFRATANDSLASEILNDLHTLAPDNPLILREWMTDRIRQGEFGEVVNVDFRSDSLPELLLIKSDAFAQTGNWRSAYDELQLVSDMLPYPYPQNFEHSFDMRADTTNWVLLNAARYQDLLPPFRKDQIRISTQTLILNEALRLRKYGAIRSYAQILAEQPADPDFFGIYLDLIDYLSFKEDSELAARWISIIEAMELRPRYKERLQEKQEWLDFVLNVDS